MTVQARFERFRLTPDGAEVVYSGRTPANDPVEIRQAVGDLDVMLVLIAHILEQSLGLEPSDAHNHQTQSAFPSRRRGAG